MIYKGLQKTFLLLSQYIKEMFFSSNKVFVIWFHFLSTF